MKPSRISLLRPVANFQWYRATRRFEEQAGFLSVCTAKISGIMPKRFRNGSGLVLIYFWRFTIIMQENEPQQESRSAIPDLLKLRPGLFWDTDIAKIDWLRQRRAVIERVTQRGNGEEIEEIKRFYGDDAFNKTFDSLNGER